MARMISAFIKPILEAVDHYRTASRLLALLGIVVFGGALWRLMAS